MRVWQEGITADFRLSSCRTTTSFLVLTLNLTRDSRNEQMAMPRKAKNCFSESNLEYNQAAAEPGIARVGRRPVESDIAQKRTS